MSLNEDSGEGWEPGSFLGVGGRKKEQGSARWECGKRGGVFQGRWAAVGNRRAAPSAPAMAVFHGCPRPAISTALRDRAADYALRVPMRLMSRRLARCISKAPSASEWSCANCLTPASVTPDRTSLLQP